MGFLHVISEDDNDDLFYWRCVERITNRKLDLVPLRFQPPDQLKDLRDAEKARLGLSTTRDYCAHCADALKPADLAERSPSFSIFRNQVLAWSG